MRARLAAEVADCADMDALDAAPYMDAFMHETLRFTGRPRQFYRRGPPPLAFNLPSLPSSPLPPSDPFQLFPSAARHGDPDGIGRSSRPRGQSRVRRG